MDQILQTTLMSLWPVWALASAAAVLGAVLRHPQVKGWRGERRVRRMLRVGLDPHRYVVLHDVLLPTEPAGGSTQIGHVVVSPYGVFVLETKHYQGWIFGSERQAQWTQKIHKNHSQKFQNPLRQNYAHTQAVQTVLALPASQVHSVVVFVGASQFKTQMPPQVQQGEGALRYIQQFQQQVWDAETMQQLIDRLESLRLPNTRAAKRAHVRHVEQVRQRKAAGQTASPAPSQRAAPTPQQAAAAPVLQEVVGLDAPSMAPRSAGHLTVTLRAPVAAPAQGVAGVAKALEGTPPVPLPLREAAPDAVAEPRPAAAVCPQCQHALRRLRLQRGPLAGQVIYRCGNTALCQYVQPLPEGLAA